jgi:hypothetical protein
MALLQRHQIQLRANQLVLREANQRVAALERDLLAVETRFKIWKKKLMIKITLSLIQQKLFRQRLLFRRLEQLNRVCHCFQFNFIPDFFHCKQKFYLSHVLSLQNHNVRQRRLRRLIEQAETAVIVAEGQVAMGLVRMWRSRLRQR